MKKPPYLFLILFFFLVAIGFYGFLQFSQVVRSIRQNQRARLSQVLSEQKTPNADKGPISPPAKTSISIPVPKNEANIENSTKIENETEMKSKISVRERLEGLDQLPIISVCRWIDTSTEFAKTFQEVAKEGLFHNFYQTVIRAEGAFGPWLFQSRLPVNRQVLLALDQEPSLLRDVEFSIQLYRAKQELEENLAMANQIETRAYYAWVLTQLAFKNPSLIGDGNLTDLCLRLQNPVQDSEEPLDSEEISSEIYKFMDRAQIKPEEFKFNPHFESKIEIKWGKEGFTYVSETPEFQIQEKR